jgi:hypothetical protein
MPRRQSSVAVPVREAVPCLRAMGFPTVTPTSARSGTASCQGFPAFGILKGYTRFRAADPESLPFKRPPAGPRPERHETLSAGALSLPIALPENRSRFRRQSGRRLGTGLGRRRM